MAEISKLNGDDLKKYRYSMRYYDERQLAIDCAVEEATEAVAVQSYKKGILDTAKNLKGMGFSTSQIAEATGLGVRQIMALR